jgi:hypothetical protein
MSMVMAVSTPTPGMETRISKRAAGDRWLPAVPQQDPHPAVHNRLASPQLQTLGAAGE